MVSQSNLSVTMATHRSISMESSGSSYMDCRSTVSDESEEEDMDYYYKNDGVSSKSSVRKSCLECWLNHVKEIFVTLKLDLKKTFNKRKAVKSNGNEKKKPHCVGFIFDIYIYGQIIHIDTFLRVKK